MTAPRNPVDAHEDPLADDVADETTPTHTSGGFAGRKAATMKSPLFKLIVRIENTVSAEVSIKDVRILAKSRDPEAISALAGLLDDDGRVGREAVRALTRFGREAEATLRRCLRSTNETVTEHARQLLAALGEATAEETPQLEAMPPTNDNQEAAPLDLGLLADPEVTRAIRGALHARGVPREDLDDGVAEVQTRILETLRVGPGPKDLSEWRALAGKVAADFAIDTRRKLLMRRKYEDDLCEDPDAFVRPEQRRYDPVDAKRLVAIFKNMRETGELPSLSGEILEGRIDGLTDAEIADEVGLTEAIVRKRREVIRGRFAWKLAALGMAELVPPRARTKKGGEAADVDDLPATLPTRRS
jgi:hypothetical protein